MDSQAKLGFNVIKLFHTLKKKCFFLLNLTGNGNSRMCNLSDYLNKLGPLEANSESAPADASCPLIPFLLLFFPGLPQSLSIPSSLEQARFRFLLSPKPFSFG